MGFRKALRLIDSFESCYYVNLWQNNTMKTFSLSPSAADECCVVDGIGFIDEEKINEDPEFRVHSDHTWPPDCRNSLGRQQRRRNCLRSRRIVHAPINCGRPI
jgi:hypothetical protein